MINYFNNLGGLNLLAKSNKLRPFINFSNWTFKPILNEYKTDGVELVAFKNNSILFNYNTDVTKISDKEYNVVGTSAEQCVFRLSQSGYLGALTRDIQSGEFLKVDFKIVINSGSMRVKNPNNLYSSSITEVLNYVDYLTHDGNTIKDYSLQCLTDCNFNIIINSVQKVLMLPNATYLDNKGTAKTIIPKVETTRMLDFQGNHEIPVNILLDNIRTIQFNGIIESDGPIYGFSEAWAKYLQVWSYKTGVRLGSVVYDFSYVVPQNEYVSVIVDIDKVNLELNLIVNGVLVETISYNGIHSGYFDRLGRNVATYLNGQLDFASCLTRRLTSSEIKKSFENPTQFFEAMRVDNDTLYITDFSGKGKYIPNFKSYSETLISTTTNDGFAVSDEVIEFINLGKDSFSIEILEVGTNSFRPITKVNNDNNVVSLSDKYYGVTFNAIIEDGSDIVTLRSVNNGVIDTIGYDVKNGFNCIITTGGNNVTDFMSLYWDGRRKFKVTITNWKYVELEGLNEIINFSEAQRLNFTNMSAGIQEIFTIKNDLGFTLGLREGIGGNKTDSILPLNYNFPIDTDFSLIIGIKLDGITTENSIENGILDIKCLGGYNLSLKFEGRGYSIPFDTLGYAIGGILYNSTDRKATLYIGKTKIDEFEVLSTEIGSMIFNDKNEVNIFEYNRKLMKEVNYFRTVDNYTRQGKVTAIEEVKPYIGYDRFEIMTQNSEHETDGIELLPTLTLDKWNQGSSNIVEEFEDGFLVTINSNWERSYFTIALKVGNTYSFTFETYGIGNSDFLSIEVEYNSGTTPVNDGTDFRIDKVSSVLTKYTKLVTIQSPTTYFRVTGNPSGGKIFIKKPSIQKVIKLPNKAYCKSFSNSNLPLELLSSNPLDFTQIENIPIDDIDTSIIKSVTFGFSGTDIRLLGRQSDWSSLLILGTNETSFRLSSVDVDFSWRRVANKRTTITININPDNTMSLFVDGVFKETVSYIGTIGNSSPINLIGGAYTAFTDGQLDFLSINTQVLKVLDIRMASELPNEFFENMKKDSECIFLTDFRGDGKYIANSKTHSISNELNDDIWSLDSGWTQSGKELTAVNGGNFTTNPDTVYSNKTYLINVRVLEYVSGSLGVLLGASMYAFGSNEIASIGNFSKIIKTSTLSNNLIYLRGNGTFNGKVLLSIKELTGLYEIINFTDPQRTNYTQEERGLQDLTRKFNSLGFFEKNVPYLNPSKRIAVANTSWKPTTEYSWTLKWVQTKVNENWSTNTGKAYIVGGAYIYNNMDFNFGESSIGHFTCNLGNALVLIGNDSHPMNAGEKYLITVSYNKDTNKLYMTINDGLYTNESSTTVTLVPTDYTLYLMEKHYKYLKGANKLMTPLEWIEFQINKVSSIQEITDTFNKLKEKGIL